MTSAADRKPLLSTFWIFAMFNYTYADLLMMIVNPEVYQRAAAKMTGSAVLVFAVLMEVSIAMILLSRVLPYRLNRWANVIAGLESTVFVALTLGGNPPLYYVAFSTLEMACTLFIAWYAWSWRIPEGGR